jgi:hypothetical protein
VEVVQGLSLFHSGSGSDGVPTPPQRMHKKMSCLFSMSLVRRSSPSQCHSIRLSQLSVTRLGDMSQPTPPAGIDGNEVERCFLEGRIKGIGGGPRRRDRLPKVFGVPLRVSAPAAGSGRLARSFAGARPYL